MTQDIILNITYRRIKRGLALSLSLLVTGIAIGILNTVISNLNIAPLFSWIIVLGEILLFITVLILLYFEFATRLGVGHLGSEIK